MLSLREFRSNAKGLPDLLPYAALVSPEIVLNKDGSLLTAWIIRGNDTASSTDAELAWVSERVNIAVMRLEAGYMIHLDAIRMADCDYPEAEASHFPEDISQIIEAERSERFKGGQYYSTRTVLSVTFMPTYGADRLTRIATAKKEKENLLEKAITAFQSAMSELEDMLAPVLHLRRLTTESHGMSQLLSFLQLCVSGEEHPVRVPVVPMYLDALIGGFDLVGGVSPTLGTQHMAVLSVDGLPSESYPEMLSVLDTLNIQARFSTRFICMGKQEALKEVNKYRKRWKQQVFSFFDQMFPSTNARVNRDAARMMENAEEAYSIVQGDVVRMGFYSACFIVLHENPQELEETVRALRRMVQNQGFGVRVENYNALEVWLGSHPGNSWANVRRPLITTINFADFLPLASTWPGEPWCPCPFYPAQSPPLMFCGTGGATPFRLNLHVGDLGHTLVLGPTGSGKSTLLATLAAQFRRYQNASIFAFDKGQSLFPLAAGSKGGAWHNVGGDSSPSFCPLQHVTSDHEQSWAEEWLGILCELQGLTVLPPHRNAIHTAMSILRNQPDGMRSLSHFVMLVSNAEIKTALKHYTIGGAMGRLLDARADSLSLSSLTVFEIEDLMNLGAKNLIPVLLYIFHAIEKAMKGQPCLLILDEAWIMLGDPVFREKIKEWSKVLRKANCAVILSTQSLSDASNSGIFDVIVESCLTKIFLPNREATGVQSEIYTRIGLNTRQCELIAHATPKRQYYVTSPEGKRLINLELGSKALSFVGASDKNSLSQIRMLQEKHGEKWPEIWLQERGL